MDSRFRGNDGLSGSQPPVQPGECSRFRGACPRESGGVTGLCLTQQSGIIIVTPVYIGRAPDSMFRQRCGYEAVLRAVQESGNPWAFMVAADPRFRGNDGLSRSQPPVRPGECFRFRAACPRESGGMTGLLSHCNNRGAPSLPWCTAMSGSGARRTPCFAGDAATRRYPERFKKAGIHGLSWLQWIPAFAGMTGFRGASLRFDRGECFRFRAAGPAKAGE